MIPEAYYSRINISKEEIINRARKLNLDIDSNPRIRYAFPDWLKQINISNWIKANKETFEQNRAKSEVEIKRTVETSTIGGKTEESTTAQAEPITFYKDALPSPSHLLWTSLRLQPVGP